MSLTMSVAERQEFLSGPHVGVLAVERPGRAPLAVPVWYGYEPGGEVLVWSYPGVKEQLVKAALRFTLTVSVGEWPYRYVSVEGPVVAIEEPAPVEVATAISVRYMGEEDGRGFVDAEYKPDQPLFRMRPERWLSGDYSKYGTVTA
jgi:nitroimidazol reductase NimA-like FMN-containing flavoprotein (pyridoxamine 5'-phosphate oxidase superfamily)